MVVEYIPLYNIDIVFCIDATGSMQPLINNVKKLIVNLPADIRNAMDERGKTVKSLRIRLIVFRDFLADQDEAMLATDFFKMPENIDFIEKCIDSIVAKNGGDIPEDGLEALALAIKSPWSEGGLGAKRRQIIVVLTDTWPHDLGYGAPSSYYPADMPKSFIELSEWWGLGQQGGYVDRHAKRLIIFAPDTQRDGSDTAWKTIAQNWDQSFLYASKAGEGLAEHDYNLIIGTIVNNI